MQQDGTIRTSWFYEYGIKKADAFKIIDPLTGLPLKDQSHLGGEWARRYTYEGYFYYPYGLEKGTYKIKIWDGCHLIGKYEISINNDVQLTVTVPYEKQEAVNFQNYLLNEINEAKEELNPDRLNELENYITDHYNILPDLEGMSQYIQSIEGFVLRSLSGGKISDITVSGDFPNSIVTTNGTLLDSKSFDGFASASVYAPSGVKTLTQYHLPARSTVQSVQNSLLDYTWDYNPERILDRKWRCYNYFSTFSIFTGGGFIVGFILGVIGVMLGIKVPKVFII
jgi:hypothetical protein